MHMPYETALREALKAHLTHSQQIQNTTSAQQTVFSKTLTLYCSYRTHGCLGSASAPTLSTPPPDDDDKWLVKLQQIRRGHDPKLTCDGQLIFDYDSMGQAFVR